MTSQAVGEEDGADYDDSGLVTSQAVGEEDGADYDDSGLVTSQAVGEEDGADYDDSGLVTSQAVGEEDGDIQNQNPEVQNIKSIIENILNRGHMDFYDGQLMLDTSGGTIDSWNNKEPSHEVYSTIKKFKEDFEAGLFEITTHVNAFMFIDEFLEQYAYLG